MEDYRSEYGNLSDDLDKLISRTHEEMEEVRVRLNEKSTELKDFHALRQEYEKLMDNIAKAIQNIETRIRQANNKFTPGVLKVTIASDRVWRASNSALLRTSPQRCRAIER